MSLKKRFKEKERHQSHNFKEGWIEFMDKRVARSVADLLNAQNIGESHSFLFEARRKKADEISCPSRLSSFSPRFV